MTDEVGTIIEETEPAVLTAATVTLVEGPTFCVSGTSGDMEAEVPQGLFFRDMRVISDWQVRVDGHRPHHLTVLSQDPYSTTFVSRVPPHGSQSELLLERRRYVGEGMREDLRLRNLSTRPMTVPLTLDVGADFADVFAVKENRVRLVGEVTATPTGEALELVLHSGDSLRGVRVESSDATARPDGLDFLAELPARGEWCTTVLVRPSVEGEEAGSVFRPGAEPGESEPARRLRAWRESAPRITDIEDPELHKTLRRSLEDLGALRIFDPRHPEHTAIAAGAPWFMALFGRDSLLSSYMALPLDQTLALGTLQTLARDQGRKTDPDTEEESGRILHETRFGLDFPLARGGGSVYYGTADATPLFVIVLGELSRWGIAPDAVEELLPHADRALQWIEEYGDRDGDGFVEYQRMTGNGLLNQGWKDSYDGVNFADGSLAEPPIALCEVQSYVYAAYVVRSHFAHEAGDQKAVEHWTQRADALKEAFNEQFWLPERGWYAVGLDRDKRPIDALASNMGHCLWTGIADRDKAEHVAERLLSPEMFTGWGVRTLASTMGAYNPMSYHNGSVWPHDNALVATGLMRYGFVEHAQRVATGILDAAEAFGGRLPELFCGFDRSDYDAPLPYPTSCSPQAWAAATPVQLVRALLRIDPWMSHGQVWVAPAWPARYGRLRIHNIPLAGRRVELEVDGESTRVTGLPDEVEIVHQPRRPLRAAPNHQHRQTPAPLPAGE
ncbi:amylo-alpha-1,6-glucosidase [Streptomyces rishiriensis]|uniref:Glycogen debranching enzyme n=1 Tax=Streptomyces rishiriensis TaxID=68264 RepID=A0ABU0NGZ3_STRRH|nr:glycogen debranching N-terminal domain-containing protein [Streptomyces rishiriensis]MDQ0578373.1 glycogen debranching enzyme [Streptomyces rishiriensis]